MQFLPVLVHTIRFMLRSGGKSDLTSEDRERSMTSITLKLTVFHDSGAMSLIQTHYPHRRPGSAVLRSSSLSWTMTSFLFFFLLDLSAAFDIIDHKILLSRLNSAFGIQSTALQWFQSYLSARYQSTSFNKSSSSPPQLMYDVPEGSVLGPILFVLYTTPLSDIIANHYVNHQLFADDTQLQTSAPLSEVTNLTKELNACTDDIKTWMTENQLKMNDDKTEAFPFRLP